VSTRAPYIPAALARERILAAARTLLAEHPFAELTIGALMAEAGLARTVFYRHFDDLPSLAPELLPDADDPLVDQVERRAAQQGPQAIVQDMVKGLVALFAEHGRLLRAIDDAARRDPAVAERMETALVGPRELLERLLRGAAHPPPDPVESARVLMAAHRAYLLDTFGAGDAPAAARPAACAALLALWERLLG
jgi:TetR/AcrR family transcriptional regulator, ethionamide resistance regulator